jgi:hypothetical protein
MLASLEKYEGEFARFEQVEQVYGRLQSLTGTSIDRTTFRSFLHDLDARFLIRIGDLDELPEYASKKFSILMEDSAKRRLEVTSLGRTFLAFVRHNEP